MNTKTIAFLNHKGGVGKTTVTANLAAELADKGNKVLLIDFDSQADLSKAIGIKYTSDDIDLYTDELNIASAAEEVVFGIRKNEEFLSDIEKYIHKTEVSENIDIIPGSLKIQDLLLMISGYTPRERVITEVVGKIKELLEYNYILIDNHPSIGLDFQNVAIASDYIVIVTEPTEFSVDGLMTLTSQLNLIKKYFNPQLQIAGILINAAKSIQKYSKTFTEFIYGECNFSSIFSTPIPECTSIETAQAERKSLRKYIEDKTPSRRTSSEMKALKAYASAANELLDIVHKEKEK